MVKVFRNEAELAKYFRQHLKNFGYSKALVDPIRGYYPSYPDYWCVLDGDSRVERVELELFSYNFYAHKHDPEMVDRVICVEDNCYLYGTPPPPKTFSLALPAASLSQARCKWKIQEILEATGKVKRERLLFHTLIWRQPQRVTHCFYCGKEMVIDGCDRLIFSSAAQGDHAECLEQSERWLREQL